MIDTVKEYLAPKRFGVLGYVCLIVYFLCGLAFIAVFVALRAGEFAKFSCTVDTKSTATYKTYVEKTCYSRYEQIYNSPLPLYGFAVLSVGSTLLVSVIYSLAVSSRVEEIGNTSNESGVLNHDSEARRRLTSGTFYVFRFYLVHLATRSLLGIAFTALQQTILYPNGFEFKFSCSGEGLDGTSYFPTARNGSIHKFNKSITCKHSAAFEKNLWGSVVSVLNAGFSVLIFMEIVYVLWRRFPVFSHRSQVVWSCDAQFISEYLLRKKYVRLPHLELEPYDCVEFYKQKLLNAARPPDIIYAQKTGLDDLYIDVVVRTGRAKLVHSEDRHEIYQVHMYFPEDSIRLNEIKDLFYPNEDTKGTCPRTILAVGRPGIGKTAMAEKILHDWAHEIDEFYSGKIAFLYKFRWFNVNELGNISLKSFLRYGTGLSEGEFNGIMEELLEKPERAILIFDGLDEFYGDFVNCLDQFQLLPNDLNTSMSAMDFFVKLVLGDLLPTATVLVTSRPTADRFYSRLNFKRNVEVIGFTATKIEEYVTAFCDNTDNSNLKSNIWNYIESSSELLNLCYIPVNCFVVCVTLSACLIDDRNTTAALPTTLTELYQTAIDHFAEYHSRNLKATSYQETIGKLQNLAFRGIENGHLVFDKKFFDEQMKKSGLLNSLSNPIFPLQTQFCFIHLTVQEFLAAKHVIETLSPDETRRFISSHAMSGKWHLVLQFIAGLFGEKIKTFRRDYMNSVLVFAESLKVDQEGIVHLLEHSNVFVMKCLREVNHEEIVRKACEVTALKLVSRLMYTLYDEFSPSDCAAVTFVCKHMKNLVDVSVVTRGVYNSCLPAVCELLRQRCIKHFSWKYTSVPEQIFRALIESKCTLNHKHCELSYLDFKGVIKDECVSNLFELIANGRASKLETLDLRNNKLSLSGFSKLNNLFDHELCGKLRTLVLSNSPIGDEGVRVLCKGLMRRRCQLDTLYLMKCLLTKDCICWLSELLQDEHCKLSELSLYGNAICDEGVWVLCKTLEQEQCKVAKLGLGWCSLTTKSMVWLSELLQIKHCKLTYLSLSDNDIGDEEDEDVRVLVNALRHEQCKLTILNLSRCLLTAKSAAWLSEVLSDEHCTLKKLLLDHNFVGNEGVRILCTNALTKEQCKLTSLGLHKTGLTDECVPLLCKTLQDRHCRLTKLSLSGNSFSEDSRKTLGDVKNTESCQIKVLQSKKVLLYGP